MTIRERIARAIEAEGDTYQAIANDPAYGEDTQFKAATAAYIYRKCADIVRRVPEVEPEDLPPSSPVPTPVHAFNPGDPVTVSNGAGVFDAEKDVWHVCKIDGDGVHWLSREFREGGGYWGVRDCRLRPVPDRA